MISVILMMAGSSSRMNANENKLFLDLGTKKVYQHSLDKFLEYGLEVICVTKEENIKYLSDYTNKVKIVIGGNTRQESVYNGLCASTKDYVLIHDAARPFVSKKIIEDCLNAINENKNFLVAAPSKDSIYLKTPITALNRDNICLAQTPQGGLKSDFLTAHVRAVEDALVATDDISLVLKYIDKEVKIITGEDINFKLTTSLDYILAKELIKND